MGKFESFQREDISGQSKRLLFEWMEIDKLCKNNNHISYVVRRKNIEGLPVEYDITYKVRSIVGVTAPEKVEFVENGETRTKEVRKPVFGDEHILKLSLPNNFPSARGNPQLNFISDIWHPNIRSSGMFKGRVCSNEKDLGVITTLAARILRIGQYLQYQLYHALDSYPYPEDTQVAGWVREEAEPMGWINMREGIFTDYSNLREKDKQGGKVLVLPREIELKASGKNIIKI
ncbi:MAG: hypothetical protein V1775_08245 [Bacteroidota bacterium]